MNIVETIQQLQLPLGSYVVFGSGPMAIRGIRESSDVDLLVRPSLYEQLKQEGWIEKRWDDGVGSLAKGNVEVFKTWNYGTYQPNPNDLISNAEIIESIPFVQLEEVLKWKQAFGREKDLIDAKMLQNYLKSNQS